MAESFFHAIIAGMSAAYRKAATTMAHNPPAALARPFARKKLG